MEMVTIETIREEISDLGKKYRRRISQVPYGEIKEVDNAILHELLGKIAKVGMKIDMAQRFPSEYAEHIQQAGNRAKRGMEFIEGLIQQGEHSDFAKELCRDVKNVLQKTMQFAGQQKGNTAETGIS